MNRNIESLVHDNQIIMIDTCFAMSDAFESFVDEVEIDLMACKKKIIVKSIVMAELYRLMGSSDEEVKRKATCAVDIICMRRNIFSIDEDKVTTEAILKGFADVEFISDFTKRRIQYKMALLTNDYKLGKDISDLNNLESCYGKKVVVFCLTANGKLKPCEYKDEDVIDPIPEKIVEKTITVKETNWKKILIGSGVSFAAGMIWERHGRHIVKTFVEAIA